MRDQLQGIWWRGVGCTDVEALKRLEMTSHVSPGDWTVALRAQAPWAPVAAESAKRTRRSEVGILVEEGCGRGGSCWDAKAFIHVGVVIRRVLTVVGMRLDITVIMEAYTTGPRATARYICACAARI